MDKEMRESVTADTSGADRLFAILAGFAITSAIFAAGIEPGAGPGLLLQRRPIVSSSEWIS